MKITPAPLPQNLFFNFYAFSFFFFSGLLNKQKSSIFKQPCGKKEKDGVWEVLTKP